MQEFRQPSKVLIRLVFLHLHPKFDWFVAHLQCYCDGLNWCLHKLVDNEDLLLVFFCRFFFTIWPLFQVLLGQRLGFSIGLILYQGIVLLLLLLVSSVVRLV
jgi:hypothetical protein